MSRVLLPGTLLMRHIAVVGEPVRYQGGTWYPLTRLCDSSEKLAGAAFIEQQCDEVLETDLYDPCVCLDCRMAADDSADDVDDPSMGTIPLFDLP